MKPTTRSASKRANAESSGVNQPEKKSRIPETEIVEDPLEIEVPPASADGTDNKSFSENEYDDDHSSSSDEESDDEYVVETHKSSMVDAAESSEGERPDERIVRELEQKIARGLKNDRILKKKKKALDGEVSDTEDVVCEYEPQAMPKQRRRRLYRRKMTRPQGVPKRRRIKRPDLELADDYTCDTFAEQGLTLKSLTSDIKQDDPEVDWKAMRRMGIGIRSTKRDEINSDEDEADIISHSFSFYQTRNSKEQVAQAVELNMNPFSEKIASYNAPKSVHGYSRSSIQNQHSGFIDKNDIKYPDELLWQEPFTHLVFFQSTFNAHESSIKFLNNVANSKKQERDSKLMKEIRERIKQKSLGHVDVPIDYTNVESTSEQPSTIDQYSLPDLTSQCDEGTIKEEEDFDYLMVDAEF